MLGVGWGGGGGVCVWLMYKIERQLQYPAGMKKYIVMTNHFHTHSLPRSALPLTQQKHYDGPPTFEN